MTSARLKAFKKTIWSYHASHRRDMPWRFAAPNSRARKVSPYQVLVSEIMLQQTQVSRVMQKYPEFMAKFPSFAALAHASLSDVLTSWQGLGYNRRAIALKKIAEIVTKDFARKLPSDYETLISFPGIGPNTAGSLLAFAFNIPLPFIETNIRSVYIHFFFPEDERAGKKVSDEELFPLIEKTLDQAQPREWYYALMDYGVMLKASLRASTGNPSRRSAAHRPQSTFKGSNREMRATILRVILAKPGVDSKTVEKQIAKQLPSSYSKESVAKNLAALEKEGFIMRQKSAKKSGWTTAQ